MKWSRQGVSGIVLVEGFVSERGGWCRGGVQQFQGSRLEDSTVVKQPHLHECVGICACVA